MSEPTVSIRLSDDEWLALQREQRGDVDVDYRPPTWRTMSSEEYRDLQRKLRPFRDAQEIVRGYAGKVNLLRWYVADLEALLAAGHVELPADVVLGRRLALELPLPLRRPLFVEPALRDLRTINPEEERRVA